MQTQKQKKTAVCFQRKCISELKNRQADKNLNADKFSIIFGRTLLVMSNAPKSIRTVTAKQFKFEINQVHLNDKRTMLESSSAIQLVMKQTLPHKLFVVDSSYFDSEATLKYFALRISQLRLNG